MKVPFVDLSLQNKPIEEEIEQAILKVTRRGDFILGQELREFETAFAQASGVEYGVGVSSGTEAIALGLQASGIGAGDEVIVPANTFIATIIAIIKAGATPILVDCDPKTALIDLEAAAKAITPKTKAIVPVHLYGQMVSPKLLLDFANSYNLLIFEDAAQAHLAQREGYGAGTIGIAAGYSFYPSKNLGAFGNGGMLITKDEEIAGKVRTLRNYGAPKKHLHVELGTNSRLDTIQAAILKVKLAYLSGWNQERNRAALYYNAYLHLLEAKGIELIENQSASGHVYHLYIIRIHPHCKLKREEIQQQLTARGIQTGIHYPIPCHLQPACAYLGYNQGDFPQTEALGSEILSLPMYPGITAEQIEYISASLRSILT